jgi:TRAP-type uncharacterized transport system substrate-binding protein
MVNVCIFILQLLLRKDSGINKLEDFKDKTFSFGDVHYQLQVIFFLKNYF